MKAVLPLAVLAALGLAVALALQTRSTQTLTTQLAETRRQGKTQTQQLAQAAEETTRLREQNAALKNESQTLRQKLAALAPGSVAAEVPAAKAADAGTFPGSAESGGDAGESGAKGFGEALEKMMAYPAMQKMLRSQQEMAVRTMYADLTRELGLPRQDTDALMNLLADRQLAGMDAGMELMNGDKPDAKKLAQGGKNLADAREPFDRQLRERLGPEGYAKFEDYEKSLSERTALSQYEQQFTASGTPLAPDQRQGLLQIMREERANAPTTGNPGTDPIKRLEMLDTNEGLHTWMAAEDAYNRRVLDRAVGVLSPEQLQTLTDAQNRMAEMMRAGMRIGREMFGGR